MFKTFIVFIMSMEWARAREGGLVDGSSKLTDDGRERVQDCPHLSVRDRLRTQPRPTLVLPPLLIMDRS